MRLLTRAALALVLASGSTALQAQDKPPPTYPEAIVTVGPCVSPALNGTKGADETGEAGIASILVGSIVPKLLGAGLDFIGGRLSALGAEQKTTLYGVRTSEAAVGPRTCLQITRWHDQGQSLRRLMRSASLPEPVGERPLVALDQPLDFFLEMWIRPSEARDAISLTPTLLYYPRPLGSRNFTRDTAVTLSGSFTPFGGSATTASWALPRQTPVPTLRSFIPVRVKDGAPLRQRLGELQRLCEASCELASPWIANPWQTSKKPTAVASAGAGAVAAAVVVPGANPSAGASRLPMNVRMEVVEIRSGSRFFKALADGFNTAKPAIQTSLEAMILAQTRATTEAQGQTAQANALVAYAGKIGEVTSAKDNYCAARGKPATVIEGLSATLSAKQTLANVAAVAAQLDAPFVPVSVSGTFNPAICA